MHCEFNFCRSTVKRRSGTSSGGGGGDGGLGGFLGVTTSVEHHEAGVPGGALAMILR